MTAKAIGMALMATIGCACSTDTRAPREENRIRWRPPREQERPSVDDAGPIRRPVDCESTFQVSAGCVHPKVEASCRDGWCAIPHGCFVMGSPDCDPGRGLYNEDEIEVMLTHDFVIGQYEVSQSEWVAFGVANPSGIDPISGNGDCIGDDCPVGGVTWFDAIAFANRMSTFRVEPLPECYDLSSCTGTIGIDFTCTDVRAKFASVYGCPGYRLPTEAEWEYAVRAGARTSFYLGPVEDRSAAWSCNEEPALLAAGWYCKNGGTRTHPRGLKTPNAWGLHEMLGNVQEWTSDDYLRDWGAGPFVDPGAQLGAGSRHAMRGGILVSDAAGCAVSRRLDYDASFRSPGRGFRLARTITPI